jgi:hypothetical protein
MEFVGVLYNGLTLLLWEQISEVALVIKLSGGTLDMGLHDHQRIRPIMSTL